MNQQEYDLVERLEELSGPRYPDDIAGKRLMAEAAVEIKKLKAALKAMTAEFRMLDLPYGSSAYRQAIEALHSER